MNILMVLMLSGAFAEVDCTTGMYTGYRYRFIDDPIVHKVPLTFGKLQPTSAGDPRCIYA